jgi:hypothetical protein
MSLVSSTFGHGKGARADGRTRPACRSSGQAEPRFRLILEGQVRPVRTDPPSQVKKVTTGQAYFALGFFFLGAVFLLFVCLTSSSGWEWIFFGLCVVQVFFWLYFVSVHRRKDGRQRRTP